MASSEKLNVTDNGTHDWFLVPDGRANVFIEGTAWDSATVRLEVKNLHGNAQLLNSWVEADADADGNIIDVLDLVARCEVRWVVTDVAGAAADINLGIR